MRLEFIPFVSSRDWMEFLSHLYIFRVLFLNAHLNPVCLTCLIQYDLKFLMWIIPMKWKVPLMMESGVLLRI